MLKITQKKKDFHQNNRNCKNYSSRLSRTDQSQSTKRVSLSWIEMVGGVYIEPHGEVAKLAGIARQ